VEADVLGWRWVGEREGLRGAWIGCGRRWVWGGRRVGEEKWLVWEKCLGGRWVGGGDKFGRDMYLGRKLGSGREMGMGMEMGWRARWIGLADELGEGEIKNCH